MAARTATKLPAPPSLADDMRRLLELVSRGPTAARASAHVEDMMAGWRERLDLDAYATRVETLLESLAEGIEQMVEDAADIDPASKAETRKAEAAVETMRTMRRVVQDAGLVPA